HPRGRRARHRPGGWSELPSLRRMSSRVSLGRVGQRGEVGAHDPPLAASLADDEGGSAVEHQHLAVFGYPGERVVSIHDSRGLVEHATRRLAKDEAQRLECADGAGEVRAELRLVVETVGNVVEDFDVVVEHPEDALDILPAESVGKALSEYLKLSCGHRIAPPHP